jgi:class 3 adenylate cyclase
MQEPVATVSPPNRQSFTLVIDRRIELGRESDGVIVVDNRVSRRHVALEPGPDGRVIVTDLGSSNGTTLDGLPLDDPTAVDEGSVVVIGDTRIEIGTPRPATRTAVHTELAGGARTAHSSIEVVADAVVEELDAHVLGVDDEPGTLTVVFSDIERSTELALALGDAVWFDVLQRHGRLVSAHVRAHRGRIVKHQGDGYMLCFRSARSALLSAIGIERDLAQTAWSPPGQELKVRIGMHTGEVLVDDGGDLFGKHVVVAARIGALAAGGEILVSSLVRQIAEPRGDVVFHSPREVELRGIRDSETVWTVDWAGYGPTSAVS